MKIIGRQKLWACAQAHPEVCQALSAWLREVEASHWVQAEEVQQQFPTTRVAGGQVLFWLCQRHYVIEARLSYNAQTVLIERVAKMTEMPGLFGGEVS